MLNQILVSVINQIAPIIVAIIIAFLLKEVVPIGSAVISFIEKKKEAVATKIGVDKYNSNLVIAKNIWNMVDEEFRITPALTKTIIAAQTMFTEKILKVVPGLTSDEIEHLRQAVAGEINKGKEDLMAPIEIVETTPKADVSETKSNVIASTVTEEKVEPVVETKEVAENVVAPVEAQKVAEVVTPTVTADSTVSNTITSTITVTPEVNIAATVQQIQDLLSKIQTPTTPQA